MQHWKMDNAQIFISCARWTGGGCGYLLDYRKLYEALTTITVIYSCDNCMISSSRNTLTTWVVRAAQSDPVTNNNETIK